MSKYIFILLSFAMVLTATQLKYSQGLEYFNNGNYKEALPILEEESKNDNRAAQYRLGIMYSKGLGVKIDYVKAAYWLTKSNADQFGYILINNTNDEQLRGEEEKDENASGFLYSISEQVETTFKMKEGREYFFSKMDKNTQETKSLYDTVLSGDTFGIVPYRANYFLPISWSKDKPIRLYSTATQEEAPKTYSKNMEVEFQLSLQKMLSYDLFGFNEYIFAAYTQKVWWQLYDVSGPFRETNYAPEVFIIVPTSTKLDDMLGLKGIKTSFIHESNGREGYRSRSWNRIYLAGLWQWDNLFLTTRIWYRINENDKSDAYYEGEITDAGLIIAESSGDDNPDIEDYLGHGDIRANYLYGKSKVGLLLRNNFKTKKRAVEINYSYPIFSSSNSFIYIKYFKGYGQSLAEYNQNVTKVAFGLSFSTELF